jgi:putative acetyltransferase
MISISRVTSENADFVALVKLLDADLAIRDGEDHSFYSQFNKIDKIRHVVLAYDNGKAIGCGAIKKFDPTAMEIKRMYILPEYRKRGIASSILSELERWARELSYRRCLLETGRRQPEAISLYEKGGYKKIDNYGQYAGIENSLCFEKHLKSP